MGFNSGFKGLIPALGARIAGHVFWEVFRFLQRLGISLLAENHLLRNTLLRGISLFMLENTFLLILLWTFPPWANGFFFFFDPGIEIPDRDNICWRPEIIKVHILFDTNLRRGTR